MKGYCIKNNEGRLLLYTVGHSSESSITRFLDQWVTGPQDFKKYKPLGYRCVPIEISEVEND